MIALIAGPSKPPRFVQGLGLPYLAAVMEKAGFGVKIFDIYPPLPETDDLEILDERLAVNIAQEQPAIVGVTIHTPAYAERVRLARFLRKHLPNALLVAGGHHASVEPEELLQNSDFNVCVIGEGERTMLEIARFMAKHNGQPSNGWLGEIPGIVYKQSGRIIRNISSSQIANLDSMPFPAHHLLGLGNYVPHPLLNIKSTGIVTYRGCPMNCAFCLNPLGHEVRKRSPAKVVEEMSQVVSHYGIRGFNFYDNLFGLDRNHTLEVCEEIIRRKLDITWECWTAGDLVDAELAEKMIAAGCIRVGFGAESGDDGILDKTHRGFTAIQHYDGIQGLKSAGLKVAVFFMIGLPGEWEGSVLRTIEFAERSEADEVCLSIYRPWPGTAVWRNPEVFGVRIVRGPNFEGYIETESLSRAAIFECAQKAGEELARRGLKKVDFLRCDRYKWE